jgi:hypothetical protein
MSQTPLLACAAFCAAALDAGALAAGQLASRPAEEWTKVLDAANRVAALRIDEIVPRLQLKPGEVVADLGAGSGPWMAAAGFRQSDDLTLLTDRYFLVYSNR